MGSRNVAEIIRSLPSITDLTYEYDSKLQFNYASNGVSFPKRINIYMPTRADYEITMDVVDKAIENGANFIVYDNWIKSTIAGNTYGERNNIKIYTFGIFLRKVQNGIPL